MTDWLLQLDRDALHMVNTRWANDWFDTIMPWVRHKSNWIPLYVIMAGAIVYAYRRNAWLPLLLCVAAVAVADQVTSSLIKPWFGRMRPCQNALVEVRRVIDCGGGYSFVSSHAANHFALAVAFAACFKRAAWLLPVGLLWATVVSYAQVYVGFHFPSDVLIGAVIGLMIAWVLALAARRKIENLQPLIRS